MRHGTEHKSLGHPDETRQFPLAKAEVLSIGEAEIGRMTFLPRCRWSDDVKPIAGTDSCEAAALPVPPQRPARDPHGRRHRVRRPPRRDHLAASGHDARVVEDEPVVVVDWSGASNYAKHC